MGLPVNVLRQEACCEVREIFVAEFENNRHHYDEDDVKKLVLGNDCFVARYLDRREGNVQKTVDMLKEVMKWRKKEEISISDDLTFPAEFWSIGALFPYNTDREGHVVLHMRVMVYRNIPELKEGMEKFAVHQMLKAHDLGVKTGGEVDGGWALFFDLTDVGFAQYDLPELVWLIQTLVKYFPRGLEKFIVYNIPWMFRPIVNFVLRFVPKEWKHIVCFANGEEIFKYVAQENLPKYMGGTCEMPHRVVPEGARPVEEMARERYGMTPEQVGNIKKHFESYFDAD